MSDEHDNNPIQLAGDNNNANGGNVVARRERPSRACTARSAARIYEAAVAEAAVVVVRRHKPRRKARREVEEEEEEEEPPPSPPNPYSGVVTPLVGEPEPSQLPRWNIRSMWELASILNFLNVFRPLLNIKAEFSVEELETALITPNNTLGEIHIPLLKAIPPVTRMALGQNTWVTVLCRKLRDWWHWVSEGELPIVASHGTEIETYKTLDPGVRVVILKALCDIRVEQDDIRSYIDDSIKHGVPLSAFRKERTGGDSHGVSFWYEDDPIIGQRLYREIRKVEVKKGKGKNVHSFSSYQWETVSTNLDEFQDVSEKLFSSKNRMESSLGKKLKNDMLPEIEKVQKKKEKLLKKQHREAFLLDGMILDGHGPGRALRGRKQVSYTFDDYDRSINEAIEITKRKQSSLEPTVRREGLRNDVSSNGKSGGGPTALQNNHNTSFSPPSPDSLNYDESDDDHESQQLDRSRRRQRPQRYSAREFVEAVSDNEADRDGDYNNEDGEDDDDIVGEAVYDEEYLKRRKDRKKMSSSSEGDEEYRWDGDNGEDEEDEDEGEESLSASENSEESPRRYKKLTGRTRRETKLRSVNEIKKGPRRSRRAARTRIDYKQFEFSDSEPESEKPETSESEDKHSEPSDKSGFSMGSSDEADVNNNDDDYDDDADNDNDNYDNNDVNNENENGNENEEMKIDQPVIEQDPKIEQEQNGTPMKLDSPDQDEFETGAQKRRFLDLNELAPGSGFEDGPVKDDDNTDDF
ncbi:putative transcription factor & chromatin remodeling DDT family [Helianthus annuus]|uniref:Transcription factor & chromatin remodeling DDT family n=1 Tax=Helianthus annuus TaxID=4232 RepID=A0A9K3J3K3_HELAN|nr:DDT domain-containing protein DDR4 isoform X2 [Helianthus annuus]KAF5807175.1 putative transcription factor & chromatin remodeling DDT family [Helianthus annuus]KAJ0585696.1 putative transcription factor & chromatin remodeling DDT family [Helianthus annuus]KAJ0923937.1 putative transcription factor & chromatin remodeling DDT family [Helianthus annuus]